MHADVWEWIAIIRYTESARNIVSNRDRLTKAAFDFDFFFFWGGGGGGVEEAGISALYALTLKRYYCNVRMQALNAGYFSAKAHKALAYYNLSQSS